MKNAKLLKKGIALVLPLALSLMAGAAQAQNYDTGSFASTSAIGQSNGAVGNVGVTSYKTGEAPNSAGLSGNTSNYSGKQLGNSLTNHLTLPYANTGGLAGIFGMGSNYSGTPQYTTILQDPIRLGNGVEIDPTNGGIMTRTGNAVTSVGGLNSGNYTGGITIGGSTVNLGTSNGSLNSASYSGF